MVENSPSMQEGILNKRGLVLTGNRMNLFLHNLGRRHARRGSARQGILIVKLLSFYVEKS